MASVRQSEFGSQSALTHESSTALDLAETSALDSAWCVVPFKVKSALALVVHSLVASDQAKVSSPGQLLLLIAAAVTLLPTTEVGRTALVN